MARSNTRSFRVRSAQTGWQPPLQQRSSLSSVQFPSSDARHAMVQAGCLSSNRLETQPAGGDTLPQ